MPKKGDILELEIEHLASTGKGVSHVIEDDVSISIFTPLTVPGDIVKVKIIKGKKSFYEANLIKVIKPSKDRIKPVCPYFGECGACDWLNISYEAQLKEKENLLRFYFQRNRVELDNIEVIPASNPLYYRKKIRLENGFYKRNSNQIIPVRECHIIAKEFWPKLKLPRRHEECFGIDEKTNSVSKDKSYYKLENQTLAYHPAGFVQSNLDMNKVLVKEVLKEATGDRILDLYCGNGNFSLPLSKQAKKVVAVEGSPRSFDLMLENINENNVTNIDPYNEDVKEFAKKRSKYDAVILDPPRTGSDEVLKKATKLSDTLVYVSCDASVLAKEVKLLEDYEITKVKLIDMFPQTRHFETVVVLKRKN